MATGEVGLLFGLPKARESSFEAASARRRLVSIPDALRATVASTSPLAPTGKVFAGSAAFFCKLELVEVVFGEVLEPRTATTSSALVLLVDDLLAALALSSAAEALLLRRSRLSPSASTSAPRSSTSLSTTTRSYRKSLTDATSTRYQRSPASPTHAWTRSGQCAC